MNAREFRHHSVGSLMGAARIVLLGVALATACAPAQAPVSAQRPVAEASSRAASVARGRVQTDRYFFELAGREIEYAYYLPSSASEARSLPLVVLLHGLTSSPQAVMRYQGVVEQAEKRGYVVVAPFGYNERGWYGSLGPGRETLGLRGRASNAADPENVGQLSEQDVWNVLEIARQRFRIDPDRTYLMGHSMGGGGSFHLAMRRPGNWAAVAPLSPAIYGDPARVRAMRDLPVIVVQGERDRLVQVENTRRWVKQMRELDMEVRYIEIPGGDHVRSIAANPSIISEVFDFFDAHRGAGGRTSQVLRR